MPHILRFFANFATKLGEMNIRHIVTAALLVCASTAVEAQESETVYNFLRLPVSAHVAALGGENISLTTDDAALLDMDGIALLVGLDFRLLFILVFTQVRRQVHAVGSLVERTVKSRDEEHEHFRTHTQEEEEVSTRQVGELEQRTKDHNTGTP